MPAHADASHELARRDPVLARLVDEHGPMRIGRKPTVAARFETIARAIVYQQLAGRAAQTIWGRTRALTGGEPFTAHAVLLLDDVVLRSAGLSRAKAAAIHDLADKVATGQVQLDRLGRLDDEAVIAELVAVRGVGPWTAQMFLMHDLHRLDVWPTGDLGVRNGYRNAWLLPDVPAPTELALLGERFRPYRSVAAWYCWRAVDGLVTAVD